MNIKIGADPELFLRNGQSYHSAFGLIPGTKEEPFKVKDGAVQVDGMALEFNIDPADNKEKFIYNISSVMKSLREMVPDDYEFAVFPTVRFPESHIKSLPEKALELGCDPDYNAYTQTLNPTPKDPKDIRSAGGHIHIGWTDGVDPMETAHFLSCCQLTRQLDFALGLPSLFLDDDKQRRNIYGRAGAFRPKSYGVEYRVLSNFWIKSPELQGLMYDLAHSAFEYLVDKRTDFFQQRGDTAEYSINDNSLVEAYYSMRKMEIFNPYWEIMGEHCFDESYKEAFLNHAKMIKNNKQKALKFVDGKWRQVEVA